MIEPPPEATKPAPNGTAEVTPAVVVALSQLDAEQSETEEVIEPLPDVNSDAPKPVVAPIPTDPAGIPEEIQDDVN
jgi:hypothetical protein